MIKQSKEYQQTEGLLLDMVKNNIDHYLQQMCKLR